MAKGMSAAAHVARVRVASPRIAGVAMEPRAVLAAFDPSTEELTLWVSCQAPFRIRAEVARLLGLAEARVRVIAPDVGGGFGVKSGPYREEVLLAWLAMKLGRPVKWIATRGEDQITTNHSRGSACDAELGVDADGRITALRARITSPLGTALMNGAAGPPWNHARLLPGCYDGAGLRHHRHRRAHHDDARRRLSRARAGPEATFVIERLMDEAARGARPRSRRDPPAQFHPRDRLPVPHRHGPGLRLGRLPPGARPRARRRRLRALRREQAERRQRGEIVGIGLASYVEPCALGWESGSIKVERSGPRHRHHRLERPRPGARDDVRPDRRRSSRRHARRGGGHPWRHALGAGGLRHLRQSERRAGRQRAGPRVGGNARQGPAHRRQAPRGRARPM